MKKKEFLPLKIKEIGEKYRQKTEKGQVETAVGVFLLSLLTILVYAVFQAEAYRASAQYMEDALAASNLASAIIDVEEYGITRNMIIGDPILAFDRYCTALKGNLRLDDDWQCENKRLISGKVEDKACLKQMGFARIVQISPDTLPLEEAMRPEVTRENIRRAIGRELIVNNE